MAITNQAFAPTGPGNTVTVAVTTSSQNVALPSGGESTLLTNTGTATAFVRLTSFSADAATVSDIPIPANGGRVIVSTPPNITNLGVIGSAATTLYATRGTGTQY